MDSLEQLRTQLSQLGDLRSVVKTMKAMSAASIRQYESAAEAIGDYYQTVEQGLHIVLSTVPATGTPFSEVTAGHSVTIVFGSDHGLCGRFNEVIAIQARNSVESSAVKADRSNVLAVGTRVVAALEREGIGADEVLALPGSAEQITEHVRLILLQLDNWQHGAATPTVDLVYHRHSGVTALCPATHRLLPFTDRRLESLRRMPWPSRRLPTYTMATEQLLRRLLRQYLFVALFRGFAESQASEHAGRLAAMQSAQRNLDEQVDEVTKVYRRARQGEITAELLDVVAGFEAIMGPADQ